MNTLISEKIKQRIITDNDFSLDLAKILKKRQESIIRLAKREDTHLNLTTYPAIEFYKSQGYSEEDIFEQLPEQITK